jgi:exonuclease III
MKGTAQSSTGDGDARMSTDCGEKLPDLRQKCRIATWNVLTLNGIGYQTSLVRELVKYKVSIAGLTECRLVGSDSRQVEGALIVHSGGLQHYNGVALVLRPPFNNALTSWQPISDRLLRARIAHRHGHLTVVVAYAPTEAADEVSKDNFYNQLSSAIQSVPPHDNLLVLGDLNAVTGSITSSSRNIVGPFGSGTPNDNSERLLSLCGNYNLSVLGSWFRRLDIRRWSWDSHDGRTKKEIDHMITRSADRHLAKSYRVYRGAEAPANTDHHLVVAEFEIQPFKRAFKGMAVRKYDVQRLVSDETLQQQVRVLI